MIAETTRTRMVDVMARFPEVVWDRFAGTDANLVVYGWIERDDDRSDLIAILFYEEATSLGWFTTSALHSADFAARLGYAPEEHSECERVEEHFAGLLSDEAMVRI